MREAWILWVLLKEFFLITLEEFVSSLTKSCEWGLTSVQSSYVVISKLILSGLTLIVSIEYSNYVILLSCIVILTSHRSCLCSTPSYYNKSLYSKLLCGVSMKFTYLDKSHRSVIPLFSSTCKRSSNLFWPLNFQIDWNAANITKSVVLNALDSLNFKIYTSSQVKIIDVLIFN